MNLAELWKKHHMLILGVAVVAGGAYWYKKNKTATMSDTASAKTPASGSMSFTGYTNADGTAHAIPNLDMLQSMSCPKLIQEYTYWYNTLHPKGTAPATTDACVSCYCDMILSVMHSKNCMPPPSGHPKPSEAL